jgi:sugar phosphate isomerase/epimerase
MAVSVDLQRKIDEYNQRTGYDKMTPRERVAAAHKTMHELQEYAKKHPQKLNLEDRY